jgi:multidrug efflux system outer membrane protein
MVQLAVSTSILMENIATNSPTRFLRPLQQEFVHVAVLTALTILSCGCALHKPPAHARVVDQALPKATPLPPNWSSNSLVGNVSDDWAKSFHDPGLERMIAEAIANNLDLRQSAARVEAARQSVIVVGSQLKPRVGATFNGADVQSKNSVSEQSQQFRSNAEYGTVAWELDVWGRLRAQRASAHASYEAAALDYASARQSLAATTAKSWYLAIETRQLLTLGQQSVDIYKQLLELVKVRRAAGKVADLDVEEATYQLDQAQSQLTIAEGQYSEAKRALEVLVGRYPAAELSVGETFAPLPPSIAAGIPSLLLERQPDIMSAQQGVLAAFRVQESAKLALLPRFALTLEGGHLSDRLLDLLHLNPWLIRTAAGMLVPIYEGGALRAEVKIATTEEQQSIAYFGKVALTAFTEVEVALTNEELLAKRLPLTEGAVNAHSEAVRIAKLRYEAGSIDLLSLLQLQEGEIASQSELIRLRNAQLANRINLHLALGGSFDRLPATQI